MQPGRRSCGVRRGTGENDGDDVRSAPGTHLSGSGRLAALQWRRHGLKQAGESLAST